MRRQRARLRIRHNRRNKVLLQVAAGGVQTCASSQALVDDGLIEACVGAMRSDSENATLGLAAMDCMLALASSDQACAALAFQGGTRQAIKMVMDSSSSALFERPTERALQLLDRVAAAKTDDEVKKNLVKQGAVECVTQAMESFPENEQIEAVGARLWAEPIR